MRLTTSPRCKQVAFLSNGRGARCFTFYQFLKQCLMSQNYCLSFIRVVLARIYDYDNCFATTVDFRPLFGLWIAEPLQSYEPLNPLEYE